MPKPDWIDDFPDNHRPRLFPIYKDSQRENRYLAIFLSVFSEVFELRESMMKLLGQSLARTTNTICFTEVTPPSIPDGIEHKTPDGLIRLKRGNKTWTAFVEAKTDQELESEQIIDYLKLSRANKVDALITISNQYATLPTHHPLHSEIPGTQTRSITLFHWSWSAILTEISILLHGNSVKLPAHRFLLEELSRFLHHPASGRRRFDMMNQEWPELVSKISGTNFPKNSPLIGSTVSAWHEEMRDWALEMSQRTFRTVTVKLPRGHQQDPKPRLKSDSNRLATEKTLGCELDVPNASAPIKIVADVSQRRIECSMEIEAPRDSKRQSTSFNWLTKQISHARPDTIVVVKWQRKSKTGFFGLRIWSTPISQENNITRISRCFQIPSKSNSRKDMEPSSLPERSLSKTWRL